MFTPPCGCAAPFNVHSPAVPAICSILARRSRRCRGCTCPRLSATAAGDGGQPRSPAGSRDEGGDGTSLACDGHGVSANVILLEHSFERASRRPPAGADEIEVARARGYELPGAAGPRALHEADDRVRDAGPRVDEVVAAVVEEEAEGVLPQRRRAAPRPRPWWTMRPPAGRRRTRRPGRYPRRPIPWPRMSSTIARLVV